MSLHYSNPSSMERKVLYQGRPSLEVVHCRLSRGLGRFRSVECQFNKTSPIVSYCSHDQAYGNPGGKNDKNTSVIGKMVNKVAMSSVRFVEYSFRLLKRLSLFFVRFRMFSSKYISCVCPRSLESARAWWRSASRCLSAAAFSWALQVKKGHVSFFLP